MSTSNSSEFNPNSDDKKVQIEMEGDPDDKESLELPQSPDDKESFELPQSPVYKDLSSEPSEPRPEETTFDVNKDYQPWTIIDTYFRDNNYYKSQHQIDSFNEFITSDDNGIRMIIKRNNP